MDLEQARQELDEARREYVAVCDQIKTKRRFTPALYDAWVMARLRVWMAQERLAQAKAGGVVQ